MSRPQPGAVRALLVALALVVCAGLPSRAAAAAADDPREVEGRALFAKGEYEAALNIYAQLFAEKVDPVYLRNIGRCNQKLRRPAKAIDAFREYLRRFHKIKPDERKEVEGFIQEMEALQADMDRRAAEEAAARRPPPAAAEEPPSAAPAPVIVAPPPSGGEAAPAPRPAAASDGGAAPPPPRGRVESFGQPGQLFVAVAIGSGYGIATGQGELNPAAHRVASNGFAPAQAGHVAPEIGFFPMPRLLLSAQLRLQYVSNLTGQTIPDDPRCGGDMYCVPETLGLAAFGRLTWLFGDRGVRPFLGLAIGGGNIRHVAKFESDKTCGQSGLLTCVDSLGSGPFLAGYSFGFIAEFGSVFDFILSVNSTVGAPKFTVNFDLNMGFGVRL